MTDNSATGTRTVRAQLERHPVAVECARAAAAISCAQADVVVFVKDRAFVVASSSVTAMMMPRQLTTAEQALLNGQRDIASGHDGVSVPINDLDGVLVGSLSVLGEITACPPDTLLPLARIVTAVLDDGTPQAEETFSRTVLDGLRDAVIILSTDLEILWANSAVCSLTGRTPAEVIGRSAADFVHPDDIERTLDAIIRMGQGLEMSRVVVRIRDSGGRYIPVEATGMDLRESSVIGGIVLSLRDAQYESELTALVDRDRQLSTAIVGGLWDGIIATDQYGGVILINEVARRMFAIEASIPPAQLSLGDLTLLGVDGRLQALSDLDIHQSPTISLVSSPKGDHRYVSTTARAVIHDDGGPLGTVIVLHDVTAERQAHDKLHLQALSDHLTGLANRRHLDRRLDELFELVPPVKVAACLVDLDHFKLVNDLRGHHVGDHLLRIAGERLALQVGSGDLLVRLGGDEFVVLIAGVEDISDAVGTAEQCRLALSAPYVIGEDRFDITASVGVALASSQKLADEDLLQRADIALYSAKERGRNRVEQFGGALAEAVRMEASQRRLLRDALENNRLVMHFQPMVDAKTGNTVGYEALARIQTDEEILGPSAFLDAIAGSELMWDLDRAGFLLACQAAALLGEMGHDHRPYMACNFSAVSLTHPGLVEFVTNTVHSAGIDASQISYEITETAALEGGAVCISTLRELDRLGFQLALDDFGTGYSSLVHLRDLPISTLKVDRSFIAKLSEHGSERAIVEAVVSLAKDLNIRVVAEGVETVQQLEDVTQLGFHTVQGWYYAPALPLAECLSNWSEQGEP